MYEWCNRRERKNERKQIKKFYFRETASAPERQFRQLGNLNDQRAVAITQLVSSAPAHRFTLGDAGEAVTKESLSHGRPSLFDRPWARASFAIVPFKWRVSTDCQQQIVTRPRTSRRGCQMCKTVHSFWWRVSTGDFRMETFERRLSNRGYRKETLLNREFQKDSLEQKLSTQFGGYQSTGFAYAKRLCQRQNEQLSNRITRRSMARRAVRK